MVKGLDNGYLYTKSIGSNNERMIFKSAYSTLDKVITGGAHINIDGNDFYVGAGKKVTAVDKTDHEINKICTLANLAMSGSDDYYLVIGLPISQYKTQKDKFIKMIMSYNNCKVAYHDKDMKLVIKDVTVYPQGAAALYSMNQTNGTYILFDIGGLTIDIALIEMACGYPTPQKWDTWYKGITTLYSPIIDAVNTKYGLTYDPSYAETILTQGLDIYGQKIDISFLDIVINRYLEELYSLFYTNYPTAISTPIYLCGGGALILSSLFKKQFPQAILMEDSQFANAKGFYRIGLQKYYNVLTKK